MRKNSDRNSLRVVTARAALGIVYAAVGCRADTVGAPQARDPAPALFATVDGVHVRIRVASALLEGRVEHRTREFLGIPYAKPPLGALRFAPPEPAEPWTGMHDAVDYGAACPQPNIGPYKTESVQDEDCLTLNVFTPEPAADALLPVMVFIHGGGFGFGTASEYDAATLCEAGPVVVVTMQYRLGALGLLTLPELDAVRGGVPSGNDALRDQQLALRWVRDNIAAFGGDPANVTLFGESTGSTSVCFQLVSPASRGLFARAIMQSDECSLVNRASTGEYARALGRDLVDALCPLATGAEIGDCLRAQDAATLAGFGSEEFGMPGVPRSGDGLAGWNVSVDGPAGVMPEPAADAFARREFAQLPLMIGSTRREVAQLLDLGIDTLRFENTAQLDAYFTSRFEPSLSPQLIALYRPDDDAGAQEAYIRMRTDFSVRCPSRALARTLSTQGGAVYLYSFDAGDARHGRDIDVLFGDPHSASEPLDATVRGYWAQFARRGDPNTSVTPDWPRYTSDGDPHMVLDDSSRAGRGLARAECDLWEQASTTYDDHFRWQ